MVKGAVEKMKGTLKPEVYDRYMTVLKNNWRGIQPIEDHIVAPMYGYKDRFEYYEAANVV